MKLRYLHDTVSLTINEELCIGCEMCIAVCPHDVFSIEGKKAKIADKDACMECGHAGPIAPWMPFTLNRGRGSHAVLEEMMSKDKPHDHATVAARSEMMSQTRAIRPSISR